MSNNTEVIIDGQLALATAAQTGEIIASGGAKDLTCIVKDGDNKEQLALKVANLNGGGGGGGLPSQTGHSGQFLTTNGTTASWGDVLPSFHAPSETVNEVSYTAAGGTSAITGKEIQSIIFNDESSTPTIYSEVSSGTKTLSFFIGQGDSYNSSTDILLEMEFAWENNILISGKMTATYNGSTSKLYFIVYNEGNYEYAYWNSVEYINGVPIYWDGTNKKIWSSLNFKANNITDIEGIGDNKISFETITQNNSLPAASSYTNKLAYVYETGTYSDIKNLIYSDGTNWNFLPGAVLQIPDERMYEAANKLTPAYCGIALTSGQLAIPARNKTYDANNDNTDDIYNNYTIGQMHEFYVDTYSWLNRNWTPMNFGTIFHGNSQWLTQEDEYSWIPEVMPDIYSSCTFINNGQTAYTQTVKVNLSNYANFCQWVFAQGTNKIKLEFYNATNAKVFLNGSAVNTSSDLLLDADSKTYIANFYNYSDSSGYVVMDIRELPYSGGGGGAPTLTWYKNNTGSSITIADTSSANLVKVYKNGILLEPTEDYSISGTTLTLTTALVATDKITTEVF